MWIAKILIKLHGFSGEHQGGRVVALLTLDHDVPVLNPGGGGPAHGCVVFCCIEPFIITLPSA